MPGPCGSLDPLLANEISRIYAKQADEAAMENFAAVRILRAASTLVSFTDFRRL